MKKPTLDLTELNLDPDNALVVLWGFLPNSPLFLQSNFNHTRVN